MSCRDYMNMIKAFSQAGRAADALQVLVLMKQRWVVETHTDWMVVAFVH